MGLIDYLRFYSRSRIFHIYGDVAGAGLQNLGLCSVLMAFEQGGILIVPHLLRQRVSFFSVSSEHRPIWSPLTTHKMVWRIYLNPDPPVARDINARSIEFLFSLKYVQMIDLVVKFRVKLNYKKCL
jgi:hypothetical protein